MADHDLSGTVLDGRYRVIEPIAEGAMGSVYRGERLELGRAVAIKVMHQELPDELASRQRFDREAKLMALLEHPNCVSVNDFGIHDGKPYLVMDLVRGTSLLEILEKSGHLEAARACDITRQVLSGLAHAHELGIVHRDIKPANIMISEKTGLGAQVRILDFGLARAMEGSTKLTTGIVVGTPNYMAPEQCKGSDVDARTDLYACGVMLFEMLTGRKPFVAKDPIQVVRKHLTEKVPTLASVVPTADFGDLEVVVARALAKAPADRYGSAVEMAQAVEAAAQKAARMSAAQLYARAVPVAPPTPGLQQATASGWNAPGESGPAIPLSDSALIADSAVMAASAGETAAPAVAPSQGPSRTPTSAAPPPVPASAGGAVPPAAPVEVPGPISGAATGTKAAAGGLPPLPKAGPYVPPPAFSTGPSPQVASARTGPSPQVPNAATGPASEAASALPRPSPQVPSAVTGPSPQVPSAVTGPSPQVPSAVTGPSPQVPSARTDPAASAASETSDAAPIAWDAPSGGAPDQSMAVPPTRPSSTAPARATDRPVAWLPLTRKQLAIAGGGVLLVAIAIVVAVRGGDSESAGARTANTGSGSAVVEEEPAPDPLPQIVERASALLAADDFDKAFALLSRARKGHPDSAELAFLSGKANFGRLYWTDGVADFREAIELDASYKDNPELLKTVLKGFITTPDVDSRIVGFMRQIGPPFRPYLEETAEKHPRKAIRARARAELNARP